MYATLVTDKNWCPRKMNELEKTGVEPLFEAITGYCMLGFKQLNDYFIDADYLAIDFREDILPVEVIFDGLYVKDKLPCDTIYVDKIFCIENDYKNVYMLCYPEYQLKDDSFVLRIELD